MIINPFDNEQEFTSSDKLITHLTQLAVDKNNVFRGYGKQSELFPNIIREKDWREQEIRLLHEFERYGLQYFSASAALWPTDKTFGFYIQSFYRFVLFFVYT